MTAPTSPYRLLGLEPGAARSAIDAAYRALMKRHHPDRGGDPEIAADINRAYAELTRPAQPPAEPPAPTDLAAALYARQQAVRAGRSAARRSRRRWPLWLVGALLAGAAGWTLREPIADLAWSLRWQMFQPRSAAPGNDQAAFVADAPGRMDRAPIADADIDGALSDARRSLGAGGLGHAADVSSRCYRRFASSPSLSGYDRCVAFDNMVLLLAGAGAVDRGVFSAASVTARQLAAGRTLDADYDMIESRLDRIRARTQRKLQPVDDPVRAAPAL